MAIITDPDDLTQGALTTVTDAVWGTPASFVVAITSAGALLPVIATGEFFEVRSHSAPENNGLYQASGTPTTSSITTTKVTGSAPIAAASESVRIFGNSSSGANVKNIHYDTLGRGIWLLEQGATLDSDGATLQAIYSKSKVDWKSDDDLSPYPPPFVSITPEQFEFIDDWIPVDNVGLSVRTRKLIRTGGWSEIAADDTLLASYAGIVTLGTFEDNAADTAYYQLGDDPTDTTATIDFTFPGPVNEAVLIYENVTSADTVTGFAITSTNTITRNDGGDWITEGYRVGGQIEISSAEDVGNIGTFTILSLTSTVLVTTTSTLTNNAADTTMTAAADNRNALKLFLRVRDADLNGKLYDQSDLPSIGQTSIDNKVFRFPLSNAADLNITETDANIASNSPYTQILIRYFNSAFSREVDTTTPRDFGIVIDVGTHSGIDGSTTAAGSTLTTAEGGITGANYTAGTLTVHEGANAGTYTISGTPSGTVVTITGTFPSTLGSQSFTLQRATPIVATKTEIYEKVQYSLRQAADVDQTGDTVTGKTADDLLLFVGDTLKAGATFPTNPNGGGSGVIIEGFDTNDTNNLVFIDNTATERTYPFVAAGTISWNANLENDTDGWYIMFYTYTERFTNTGFHLTAPSSNAATLNSSTTDLTAELVANDYIRISGMASAVNNGIFRVTGTPAGAGPWTVTVEKVNGDTLIASSAGPSISVDKNPLDSPAALIVQDNSASAIRGTTFGSSDTSFDFDYDGNVQGGRTAGTNAVVTIRFGGYSFAQNNEITGTITRTTGLSFSLVAGLERNYSNP